MPRIYYGWFLVPLSILAYTLIMGITYASFGLFVVPVSQEYGLSRADMNTALVFVQIGLGLTGPFVGRMLDVLPIKPVIVCTALGAGLSLLTLATTSSLRLSMIILLAIYPFCMHGAGIQSINVLLVRWFRIFRTRAIALSALGMACGTIVMPPIVGAVVDHWGWRTALAGCGALFIALLLPAFLLIRTSPGPRDIESRQATIDTKTVHTTEADVAMQAGAILRTPHFWTLIIGAGVSIAVASSLLASLVPIALSSGLDTMKAASLVSANGLGGLAGKLLLAAYGDRVDRLTLLAGACALLGVLCASLGLASSYDMLLGISLCLGLTGTITPIFYALLADRFGQASFGTVFGLMSLNNAIICAVALRLAGEVFDRTGGYGTLFVIFAAVQTLAVASLLSTRLLDRRQGMAGSR